MVWQLEDSADGQVRLAVVQALTVVSAKRWAPSRQALTSWSRLAVVVVQTDSQLDGRVPFGNVRCRRPSGPHCTGRMRRRARSSSFG